MKVVHKEKMGLYLNHTDIIITDILMVMQGNLGGENMKLKQETMIVKNIQIFDET